MGISSSPFFLTMEVSVRGDKVKVCTVGPPVSPNCCICKLAPLAWVMPPSELLLRLGWHLPLAQALAWSDLAMRSDGGNLYCVHFHNTGWAGSWGRSKENRERTEGRPSRSRLSPEGLWTFLYVYLRGCSASGTSRYPVPNSPIPRPHTYTGRADLPLTCDFSLHNRTGLQALRPSKS